MTRLLTLAMTAAALSGPAAPAAHPLGDFSVNRYNGLVVTPQELRVDHVEDLAEIPTAQSGPRAGADRRAWGEARCAAAARDLRATADRRPLTFTVRSAVVAVRAGQAGLPTVRVECALAAPARPGPLTFQDGGGAGTAGWREITARGDGATLSSADVPEASRSGRLTAYPDHLLSDPPRRDTARLVAREGGPVLGARPDGLVPGPVRKPVTAFTELVSGQRFGVGFALVSLLLSVLLGAAHALAPGHGKTIMAAYAAGRGTRARRDVAVLALTVTFTHTAGVLALGAMVLTGTVLSPGLVFGGLGAVSGLLVMGVGAVLFRRAVRRFRHHHDHDHHHGHGHGHGHHHHEHGSRRGAAFMGFAGGMVPSPSAVLVLVGAAAVGRAWFGVLLVLAYGLGLALALALVGLLVTGIGHALVLRLSDAAARRRVRAGLLPLGASVAVVVLGLGLVLRGVSTTLG